MSAQTESQAIAESVRSRDEDSAHNEEAPELQKDEDEEDEEEFSYPGVTSETADEGTHDEAQMKLGRPEPALNFTSDNHDENEDEEEPFVYPTTPSVDASQELSLPQGSEPDEPVLSPTAGATQPTVNSPSPAQLEAIYAASSAGDLSQLKRLFRIALEEHSLDAFALANDATSRTGLTPLHAAASRGHLNVAKWLVRECGAMPDLEDKEGETLSIALHKAALSGHLPIIQYLLASDDGQADVHVQDADGYTTLHNACSKGYLDIVRWLCEHGGANKPSRDADGVSTPGVDMKSKAGWTPLMNAASKGHLPVVLYLLSKQSANPLVRNNWGETAFDVAAAVFEIWICEVLQQAEAKVWRTMGTTPYNPLAVHSTVPLVLYEYQRLDTRPKTLAVNGGRPRFSAYHLGRKNRKPPFELMLWGGESDQATSEPDENGRTKIPAWRSSVQLPLLDDSFTLPRPNANPEGPNSGAERSHFWMSDWTLDVTHPRVDVDDGWQYARTLEDLDERWGAEIPPQLERLLTGSGLVSAMLAGSSSSGASPGPSRLARRTSSQSRTGPAETNLSWARRRRWVRVMRRRLDVSPLPFLEPNGLFSLSDSGSLVPYVADPQDETHSDFGGEGGQEMGVPLTSFLTSHRDYIARACYLASGSSDASANAPDEELANQSAADVKRVINRLTRAVSELRLGILGDHDIERRTSAEVLINTYNRQLEKTRLAAGARGIPVFDNTAHDDDEENDINDNDSDDSFHYPMTPSSSYTPLASGRPASIRSHHTDYFSLTRSSSRAYEGDLTPQLAQAAEFRVPTHDAPQKSLLPRYNTPVAHALHSQWEADERVSECRSCKKRFTFYFRKHCRRCGRVFCKNCSTQRALLDPSDIVQDPASLTEVHRAPSLQRVCEPCFDEVNTDVPRQLRPSRSSGMESLMVSERSLSVPGSLRNADANSQISDLADCPVCSQNLAELGPASAQQKHVRDCLEGNNGTGQQGARYIVYKLPAESVLIGTECVICLEEFEKATLVARLSCLCTFHNQCLSAWLQRGRACPVHARDT